MADQTDLRLKRLERRTGTLESAPPAAYTLQGLSNVTITSAADGEVLRYNGTIWINNTLAEASIAPLTYASATPSAPASGTAFFYDTDDNELYYYDTSRSHWFSVTTYTMRYGETSSISDGQNLRAEYGHVEPNGSRGIVPGFDMTVIGMSGRTNGAFTGSFKLYDGGTDSGVALSFSSSNSESDYTLDYDITSGRAIGCRVGLTSGTPTNPGVEIHYKRRK